MLQYRIDSVGGVYHLLYITCLENVWTHSNICSLMEFSIEFRSEPFHMSKYIPTHRCIADVLLYQILFFFHALIQFLDTHAI